MQTPSLYFETSPWYLILCLLAGLIYAALLYRKSGPWGPAANKVLFVLRMLAVALIAVLLVSPVLRQLENEIEDPTLVFAVDNSSSIAEVLDTARLEDITSGLKGLAAEVSEKYRIEYRNLAGRHEDGIPQNIVFKEKSTDLHQMITDIRQDYEGRNLGGVILISDGIYNQGMSPTFTDYNFKIHTVGVGDTVPKSDLSILSLLYNKISYQGNRFPLIAQITHKGFSGERVRISVVKNGKAIASEQLKLSDDNKVQDVKFLIEANEKGYQRYQVVIERREGEFTHLNNVQQAYVEVVEGKERIALIAPAPHPDIKALKSAVESNANYTIDQYILSLANDARKLAASNTKYDLVIYHQLPGRRSQQYIDKFERAGSSSLIIYGRQTDPRQFNTMNKVVQLEAAPNQNDAVTGAFNPDFKSFSLSDELQQALEQFPPIMVPFGQMDLLAEAEVLLYQKVGNVTTNKPLIAVKSGQEIKRGVIMGAGLWQWRLTDYAQNDDHEAFNELITKLVQYLSSREDKRKFKAYPLTNEFYTNEKVVFDTEVYNALYEPVYGNKIDLTVTNSGGEQSGYSFVTSENNTRYAIGGLPEGVYQYAASTVLEGKNEVVKGEFLVKELQLENLNLTADFDLLRKIAGKTGGTFVPVEELGLLEKALSDEEIKGMIHTSEQYLPFIYLRWLFFLLLGLIATEWFMRKYNGSY